jgi:hypothetical protein
MLSEQDSIKQAQMKIYPAVVYNEDSSMNDMDDRVNPEVIRKLKLNCILADQLDNPEGSKPFGR